MPDCYPQLTDTQRTVRDTIRRIVETELEPHVEAMEHGDVLPYPYIKKLAAGLGMAGTGDLPAAMAAAAPEDRLEFLVPAAVGIEIARVCGGVLVSYGVSYGQVAGTIRRHGTPAQVERWVPGLMSGEIIGAWGLTEPGAGSDAFGSMITTARPEGDGFMLKGQKTFPVIDGVRYCIGGDRARWAEDGRLLFLGRDSACINTGGEKVYAEEVERVVKGHPSVEDALVVGVRDARWGQRVTAVMSLRGGGAAVTVEELRAHCAPHLADYKIPRAVVVAGEIVRSPSGKPDYAWAKAFAEEASCQMPTRS